MKKKFNRKTTWLRCYLEALFEHRVVSILKQHEREVELFLR